MIHAVSLPPLHEHRTAPTCSIHCPPHGTCACTSLPPAGCARTSVTNANVPLTRVLRAGHHAL
eukprot:11122845-Alexandrium_andersonii.AAC.1